MKFYFIVFVVLLDQLTKLVIRLSRPEFYLIHFVKNTGAAFSILKGNNQLLIYTALIVLGLMLYYYDKLSLPYALIMGGIIGNLIDRLYLGYVVDFIDLHFWPVFNIADSAITIGVLWLIFSEIRATYQHKHKH